MADSEGQTKEETKGGSPKPDTDVAPPLISKQEDGTKKKAGAKPVQSKAPPKKNVLTGEAMKELQAKAKQEKEDRKRMSPFYNQYKIFSNEQENTSFLAAIAKCSEQDKMASQKTELNLEKPFNSHDGDGIMHNLEDAETGNQSLSGIDESEPERDRRDVILNGGEVFIENTNYSTLNRTCSADYGKLEVSRDKDSQETDLQVVDGQPLEDEAVDIALEYSNTSKEVPTSSEILNAPSNGKTDKTASIDIALVSAQNCPIDLKSSDTPVHDSVSSNADDQEHLICSQNDVDACLLRMDSVGESIEDAARLENLNSMCASESKLSQINEDVGAYHKSLNNADGIYETLECKEIDSPDAVGGAFEIKSSESIHSFPESLSGVQKDIDETRPSEKDGTETAVALNHITSFDQSLNSDTSSNQLLTSELIESQSDAGQNSQSFVENADTSKAMDDKNEEMQKNSNSYPNISSNTETSSPVNSKLFIRKDATLLEANVKIHCIASVHAEFGPDENCSSEGDGEDSELDSTNACLALEPEQNFNHGDKDQDSPISSNQVEKEPKILDDSAAELIPTTLQSESFEYLNGSGFSETTQSPNSFSSDFAEQGNSNIDGGSSAHIPDIERAESQKSIKGAHSFDSQDFTNNQTLSTNRGELIDNDHIVKKAVSEDDTDTEESAVEEMGSIASMHDIYRSVDDINKSMTSRLKSASSQSLSTLSSSLTEQNLSSEVAETSNTANILTFEERFKKISFSLQDSNNKIIESKQEASTVECNIETKKKFSCEVPAIKPVLLTKPHLCNRRRIKGSVTLGTKPNESSPNCAKMYRSLISFKKTQQESSFQHVSSSKDTELATVSSVQAMKISNRVKIAGYLKLDISVVEDQIASCDTFDLIEKFLCAKGTRTLQFYYQEPPAREPTHRSDSSSIATTSMSKRIIVTDGSHESKAKVLHSFSLCMESVFGSAE
ncbi:serine-rich adhesin for platelets-like [Watersipora subatra]|uniref:serine-rich adhesin for platelets-like n=1 Tax=Watersipora subatra TaxID=2589382 RepID=UPI00355AEC3E